MTPTAKAVLCLLAAASGHTLDRAEGILGGAELAQRAVGKADAEGDAWSVEEDPEQEPEQEQEEEQEQDMAETKSNEMSESEVQKSPQVMGQRCLEAWRELGGQSCPSCRDMLLEDLQLGITEKEVADAAAEVLAILNKLGLEDLHQEEKRAKDVSERWEVALLNVHFAIEEKVPGWKGLARLMEGSSEMKAGMATVADKMGKGSLDLRKSIEQLKQLIQGVVHLKLPASARLFMLNVLARPQVNKESSVWRAKISQMISTLKSSTEVAELSLEKFSKWQDNLAHPTFVPPQD